MPIGALVTADSHSAGACKVFLATPWSVGEASPFRAGASPFAKGLPGTV